MIVMVLIFYQLALLSTYMITRIPDVETAIASFEVLTRIVASDHNIV